MSLPCAVDLDLQRHMRELDADDAAEREVEERALEFSGDINFVLDQLGDCMLADEINDAGLLSLMPRSVQIGAEYAPLTGDDALAILLTFNRDSDAHKAALEMLRALVSARAKKASKQIVYGG